MACVIEIQGNYLESIATCDIQSYTVLGSLELLYLEDHMSTLELYLVDYVRSKSIRTHSNGQKRQRQMVTLSPAPVDMSLNFIWIKS